MKRFILIFILSKVIFAENTCNFSDYFKKNIHINLDTKGLQIGSLIDFAVKLDNEFIFVDPKGKQVAIFAEKGTFKKFIGRSGEGPGEFQTPKSVAIDKEGKIYIADNDARRINIFDRNGDFLNSFVITGMHWVPWTMRINSNGDIFMAGYKEDFEHPFTGTWIHKYNIKGKYLKSFYPTNRFAIGQLLAYYSLCSFDIDTDDYLFAVQASEYKIYKHDSEGRLIKTFGKAPSYFIKPKRFPPPKKWQLLSDKEREELTKSWTHIKKLIIVKNKYILLILETNNLLKRYESKYIIDIYDKDGNLIVGGLGTNYKLLCKDHNSNLYFLIYTDEEDPTRGEPQYIIGKYSLKLE